MHAPRLAASAPRRAGAGIVKARPGEDLNLLAGQLYFGAEAQSIRTLLGSCVAVTLWHPQRKLGGMCHFLLPLRIQAQDAPRDGRFGDEAIEMLVQALERHGTQPKDYQAHLYGGADTMPDLAGVKLNIGERNIERGWQLIDHYGFSLQAVDVGDCVPRNVKLTLATGEVQMRRAEPMKKAASP